MQVLVIGREFGTAYMCESQIKGGLRSQTVEFRCRLLVTPRQRSACRVTEPKEPGKGRRIARDPFTFGPRPPKVPWHLGCLDRPAAWTKVSSDRHDIVEPKVIVRLHIKLLPRSHTTRHSMKTSEGVALSSLLSIPKRTRL